MVCAARDCELGQPINIFDLQHPCQVPRDGLARSIRRLDHRFDKFTSYGPALCNRWRKIGTSYPKPFWLSKRNGEGDKKPEVIRRRRLSQRREITARLAREIHRNTMRISDRMKEQLILALVSCGICPPAHFGSFALRSNSAATR